MDAHELRRQVKKALQELYGERLKGVILFGSEARGDARPGSDIDFLILLEGPVKYWQEMTKVVDVLYSLQLEYPDRILSYILADAADYEAEKAPLYSSVKAEGVAL